jgi:hypothetical protein
MPIRAKQPPKSPVQAFSQAAGAAKNRARPWLILGGIAYGLSTGMFNFVGGKVNDNNAAGTIERSEMAYLEKVGGNVATMTISVHDITDTSTDGNKIYLNDAAFKQANKAYDEYRLATKAWEDKVTPVIHAVGNAGNDGFTLTYNDFSFSLHGEGDRLMEIADRYSLALLPSESAMAWPEMTIRQDGGGAYKATIRLSNNWNEADNAEAMRAFLRLIGEQEKLTENVSGTYKVRRETENGALVVFQPGADRPQQSDTLRAAPQP